MKNKFTLLWGTLAVIAGGCGDLRVTGDTRRAYTTHYNYQMTRVAPYNDPNLEYKGGKKPVKVCSGVPSRDGFHCE